GGSGVGGEGGGGEERARGGGEGGGRGVEDGGAEDVGGHQVGGELDALESTTNWRGGFIRNQQRGEAARQQRLGGARDALNEHVAAHHQGCQQQPQWLVLVDPHAAGAGPGEGGKTLGGRAGVPPPSAPA